jgi:hypothetical protein
MSLFDIQRAKIERLQADSMKLARHADESDMPRSTLEPHYDDKPGSEDREKADLADQHVANAIKHLGRYKSAGDEFEKDARLEAAAECLSNARALRTPRRPSQASVNRGIGMPKFATYIGG